MGERKRAIQPVGGQVGRPKVAEGSAQELPIGNGCEIDPIIGEEGHAQRRKGSDDGDQGGGGAWIGRREADEFILRDSIQVGDVRLSLTTIGPEFYAI